MVQDQQSSAAQAASAQQAASTFLTPNQYHLHGGGISVSYIPNGEGPIVNKKLVFFTYQDAHRALIFGKDEVRTIEVADLGTVVSVTLALAVDANSTTFSLLLPAVNLPHEGHPSATIHTEGITTIHRSSILPKLLGQREVYTVTPLHGTAVFGPVPL